MTLSPENVECDSLAVGHRKRYHETAPSSEKVQHHVPTVD